MTWMRRLERKLDFLAVPGLITFLAAMNAVVYVLALARPELRWGLSLVPGEILKGEVWRAATFLFVPPASEPLWFALWLSVLWGCGRALENAWGDVRFNLYYLIATACTAAVSLLLGVPLSALSIHTSVFLAFAALNPDLTFMLFFILPVKAWWLAGLTWLALAWNFLLGSLPTRLAILASVANYLLFFGPDHWSWLRLRRRRWK